MDLLELQIVLLSYMTAKKNNIVIAKIIFALNLVEHWLNQALSVLCFLSKSLQGGRAIQKKI